MLKFYRNNNLLVNAFILLCATLWVVGSYIWFPASSDGMKITAPKAGFYAPDFSLPDQTDQLIQLKQFEGQIVVLNFWASWCTPCRIEMPAIQQVYASYKDQDFVVLAVNAPGDNPADALDFARSLDLSFPILFDSTGEVSRIYGVSALPTTYIIRSDGLIEEVLIGGPLSEALLSSKIEQLMKESED